MGNVGVTTGPRKTTLELSESPFNNPLWVNTPVTTAPRSDVLNADERRRRIAAILAKGVLRLRSFAQVPHDSAESGPASKKSSEPGGKALEVSATPSLHATQG